MNITENESDWLFNLILKHLMNCSLRYIQDEQFYNNLYYYWESPIMKKIMINFGEMSENDEILLCEICYQKYLYSMGSDHDLKI